MQNTSAPVERSSTRAEPGISAMPILPLTLKLRPPLDLNVTALRMDIRQRPARNRSTSAVQLVAFLGLRARRRRNTCRRRGPAGR